MGEGTGVLSRERNEVPRSSQGTGATINAVEPFIIESCHSTWFFDAENMCFSRVLKGSEFREGLAATQWRPYCGLEIDPDSESFTVLLNVQGTRLLRSWRHRSDCGQCGGHTTSELSLDELRSLVRGTRYS